jgi:hypothetical protein
MCSRYRHSSSATGLHWPLGQRRGFDKGSISASEGVLGAQGAIHTLCFQLVTDPEFPVTAQVTAKGAVLAPSSHLERWLVVLFSHLFFCFGYKRIRFSLSSAIM